MHSDKYCAIAFDKNNSENFYVTFLHALIDLTLKEEYIEMVRERIIIPPYRLYNSL